MIWKIFSFRVRWRSCWVTCEQFFNLVNGDWWWSFLTSAPSFRIDPIKTVLASFKIYLGFFKIPFLETNIAPHCAHIPHTCYVCAKSKRQKKNFKARVRARECAIKCTVLKSVHFKKTVAQSGFLSKELSFHSFSLKFKTKSAKMTPLLKEMRIS